MTMFILTCIAFFFLLCPCEYTKTSTDDQAFGLDNISLYLSSQKLSPKSTPDHKIKAGKKVSVTFTKQKNIPFVSITIPIKALKLDSYYTPTDKCVPLHASQFIIIICLIAAIIILKFTASIDLSMTKL